MVRRPEAALCRQRHGAAWVDVVDPHPHAGDARPVAAAPQVGLTRRGASLRRRAVRRVIHGRRGLAVWHSLKSSFAMPQMPWVPSIVARATTMARSSAAKLVPVLLPLDLMVF
jgi:hypothetical protein